MSRPSLGSNDSLGRATVLTVSEQHSVHSLQRGCAIKTVCSPLTRPVISEHHMTAAKHLSLPIDHQSLLALVYLQQQPASAIITHSQSTDAADMTVFYCIQAGK